MSDEPTPHDIELAVYAANPVAWFELYGRIEDKSVGSDPNRAPEANYLQEQVGEAVAWCIEHKRPIRLILYKPRQQGCSTISVEVLYVLGRVVKMKVLIIGGQASQTDNLWKILRYYAAKDSFEWGNTWDDNQERATCSNGTLWERETAGDKEAGRSGNYHAVLATEVARWPTDGAKNAADVLNSVLNCVGDGAGTVVIMESTAQGPKGVFPSTWAGAVTLEQARGGYFGNGYIKIFAPWYKFPRCWTALEDGETVESLRLKIEKAGDDKALRIWEQLGLEPERVKWFHDVLQRPECGGDPMKRDREYPTFEVDGFKASAPSRFDLKALELLDAYAASRANDLHFGVLERDADDRLYQRVRFRPTSRKEATVCMIEPPEEHRRYIASTDNGRGKSFTEGGDTDPNAWGITRQGFYDDRGAWHPPEPVMVVMPENRWDQDIMAEQVARMSAYYGRCMTVPEANRGELLIKCLRDKGVMLYERQRREEEVDSGEHSGLLGWETTPETKRFLVENLASAIRTVNRPGAGIRIAFPWIIDELRTFVRHKDGTEGALKMAGCHDDFVIMLGIGMACLESATTFHRPRLPARKSEGLPSDSDGRPSVW